MKWSRVFFTAAIGILSSGGLSSAQTPASETSAPAPTSPSPPRSSPVIEQREGDLGDRKVSNYAELRQNTDPLGSADMNDNQLPDDWERYFLGSGPHGAADDGDLDGLTNLQEFLAGYDPVDFYNDRIIVLHKVSGDGQGVAPGQAPVQPLVVRVQDDVGNFLENAPVVFRVDDISGSAVLVRTDAQGLAAAALALDGGDREAKIVVCLPDRRSRPAALFDLYIDYHQGPAAPEEVAAYYAAAEDGRVGIHIEWLDVSGDETGFKVERKENDGPWAAIAILSQNAPRFEDYNIRYEPTYRYRITSQ